jgi:hypothetical protein
MVESMLSDLLLDGAIFQSGYALSQARINEPISNDISRCPSHVRKRDFMPQIVSIEQFIFIERNPTVRYWTMPLARACAESQTNWHKFHYQPSTLAVNHRIGLFLDTAESFYSEKDANSGCDDQNPSRDKFWPESPLQVIFCLLVGTALVVCGCQCALRRDGLRWNVLTLSMIFIGLGLYNLTLIASKENGKQKADSDCSHGENTVTQKYLLTSANYCNTLNHSR